MKTRLLSPLPPSFGGIPNNTPAFFGGQPAGSGEREEREGGGPADRASADQNRKPNRKEVGGREGKKVMEKGGEGGSTFGEGKLGLVRGGG